MGQSVFSTKMVAYLLHLFLADFENKNERIGKCRMRQVCASFIPKTSNIVLVASSLDIQYYKDIFFSNESKPLSLVYGAR